MELKANRMEFLSVSPSQPIYGSVLFGLANEMFPLQGDTFNTFIHGRWKCLNLDWLIDSYCDFCLPSAGFHCQVGGWEGWDRQHREQDPRWVDRRQGNRPHSPETSHWREFCHSLIHYSIHSLVHSLLNLFTHSFIHCSIHSLIPSVIYSFFLYIKYFMNPFSPPPSTFAVFTILAQTSLHVRRNLKPVEELFFLWQSSLVASPALRSSPDAGEYENNTKTSSDFLSTHSSQTQHTHLHENETTM